MESRILQALDKHRRSRPGAIAIHGSRETLSWQQLQMAVDQLAAELAGSATLGLHISNSPAWIAADLAALRGGICNVPLPVFFSDTQLQHAVEDAAIDTIITDQPQRFDALIPIAGREEITIAGRSLVRLHLPTPSGRHTAAAKITYTSGSTGNPRGVPLALDAIETVTASLATAAEAGSGDRAMVLLPLSILLENIGLVYVPILVGAGIIVPDAEESGIQGSSRIDTTRFASVLRRHHPSTLIVPPQLLKLLVHLTHEQPLPESLRFIAVGGAPTGRALLESAAAAGLPVYQGYGLSECCSVVALNSRRHNRPGSVGKPLPHTRVRIDGNGEIWVRGVPFEGYLNAPAMVSNANSDELATGDLGYIDDDGYLFVTGRSRNRIITDFGRNVSPEWVESELTARPEISQAAVFGDRQPRLTVVIQPALDASADAIRAAVSATNARLPDYARIGQTIIADEPFSPGNGQMTVGLAPDRAAIAQCYRDQFAQQPQTLEMK